MKKRTYTYECFVCGAREEREVDPKMKREQWCSQPDCGQYMKLIGYKPVVPAFMADRERLDRYRRYGGRREL